MSERDWVYSVFTNRAIAAALCRHLDFASMVILYSSGCSQMYELLYNTPAWNQDVFQLPAKCNKRFGTDSTWTINPLGWINRNPAFCRKGCGSFNYFGAGCRHKNCYSYE